MNDRGKIVAIVEARMTSSRLPGKHMLTILDKPVLKYLIERLEQSNFINEIVVAITDNHSDNILAEYLELNEINFFRGSEENVMLRVIEAAEFFSADIICEVTGDCPLIDPKLIDELIKEFLNSDVEYACNGITGLPDGMGSQVFKLDTIKKSYKMTQDILDREHVTLHIRNNPEIFSILSLPTPNDLCWPELGLTLDEKSDFQLIKLIIEEFRNKIVKTSCKEILLFLKENPELASINQDVKRKGAS